MSDELRELAEKWRRGSLHGMSRIYDECATELEAALAEKPAARDACPKCHSRNVDGGTEHGSTYDRICKDCGHRFDIGADDEPPAAPPVLQAEPPRDWAVWLDDELSNADWDGTGSFAHRAELMEKAFAAIRREAEQAASDICEAFIRVALDLKPGKPNGSMSAQFEQGYYSGLEAYRQALRALADSPVSGETQPKCTCGNSADGICRPGPTCGNW